MVIFDLNVSATNLAGTGLSSIELVVDKAAPIITSLSPRNVTSTTAYFQLQVESDGGAPLAFLCFGGDNDGGINSNVNPNDDILWDHRIDLNGTYSEGMVSYLVDNLSKGQTYFYRWMASNSVSSGVWSLPPQDGIKGWWKFDESSGVYAIDETGENIGNLVAMDSSSRVFGKIGNSVQMGGTGEHINFKGFKGVVGGKQRTVSFWIKTSSLSGSLVNWGNDGYGSNWEFSLKNGSLHLDIGGSRIWGNSILNNNSWRHVALVMPRGAKSAQDVFVYVDGQRENVISQNDFDFTNNTISGLRLWLDASDLSSAETTWNDLSGNNNHATKHGSPQVLEKALNKMSVMKYSGTNGEYHSFNRISDIRTVFAVMKYNAGYWYLLGDWSGSGNGGYHDFHGNGASSIFHGTHAHNNVKNGSVFKINNKDYSIYGAWPNEYAVVALKPAVMFGPIISQMTVI